MKLMLGKVYEQEEKPLYHLFHLIYYLIQSVLFWRLYFLFG